MIDKFTEKGRRAVLKAREYVRERQQQDVQIAHLLKGMMDLEESISVAILQKLNVDIADILDKLSALMDTYPKVYGAASGSHLSFQASQAIQAAQSLSRDFGDEFVEVDMILAGMFTVPTDPTVKTMIKMGVNKKDLSKVIKEMRKGKSVKTREGKGDFEALEKYAVNLNERARTGKLDRIIGRDEE
ncbi:MAG: type VI secretion system ATPase TssH, partial [Saprospiraceae bacterium]|nr:type VI secretion system ATPase TssH [Saprospiraceae bacterium]